MENINKVASITLLFWVMKILATTLGETLGDLLTKPIAKGGLDLGTLPATLVTAVLLALIVGYSTREERLAHES